MKNIFLSFISFVLFPLTSTYSLNESQKHDEVIIQRFLNVFKNINTKKGVKTLQIKKTFSSDFEMYASFDLQDNPFIQYSEFTAQETATNPKIFLLLLCHELGHFEGGFPYKRTAKGSESWSSSEGQADYFATAVCLKKYFEAYPPQEDMFSNNETPFTSVRSKSFSSAPSSEIDETCSNSKIKFCKEILRASYGLSKLFAKFAHFPYPLSIKEKDFYQTNKTILEYSNPQCRLDTFVAGTMCRDNNYDFCTKNLTQIFSRPTCWFAESFESVE